MISFDKIVKKMCEKKWKIFTIDDIQWMYFVMDKKGRAQAYKLILRLKAANILMSIRNGIYFVNAWEEVEMIDIIDTHYWQIVRAILSSENQLPCYFLAGTTPLHIHNKSFWAPESLLIYTTDLRKSVKLSTNHTIRFTTIAAGKGMRWTNAFVRLSKYCTKQSIEWISFLIPGRELALFEALLHEKSPLQERDILQFIKKYHSILQESVLADLVKIRYISSINKLREISFLHQYESLYKSSVKIITREGRWCFMTIHGIKKQK
jgi:hypothetical protein